MGETLTDFSKSMSGIDCGNTMHPLTPHWKGTEAEEPAFIQFEAA